MEIRTEVIIPNTTTPLAGVPLSDPAFWLLSWTWPPPISIPTPLLSPRCTLRPTLVRLPPQSPCRLGLAGCLRRPLPHPETRRHRVQAAAALRQLDNRALGRPYLSLRLRAHLR